MLRTKWCALVCLLLSLVCHAGTMPINTNVVGKSVVFLYTEQNAPVGTGFLVAIPLKNDPGKMKVAIITARHVVDPQWACGTGQNPAVLLARFNVKNYTPGQSQSGTFYGRLDLIANGRNVFFTDPDDR